MRGQPLGAKLANRLFALAFPGHLLDITIKMSITDSFRATKSGSPKKTIINNSSLLAVISGIEAIALAVVYLLGVALYHLAFLQVELNSLSSELYLIFAGVLGISYALFSVQATSQLLHGEQPSLEKIATSLMHWTMAFSFALLSMFLLGKIGELSRGSSLLSFSLGLVIAPLLRNFIYHYLANITRSGQLQYQKIALIGKRRKVLQFLMENDLWRHGYEINNIHYLDDVEDEEHAAQSILEFAGSISRAGVEHVLMTGDIADFRKMRSILRDLKPYAINVSFAVASGAKDLQFLGTTNIGNVKAFQLQNRPISATGSILKNMLDKAGAIVGLTLLSPLFLAIAALIKYDSAGPVFYKQKRRGFNGQEFTIFKFRSMTVMEPGNAMRQATRGDARITKIGKILRATSLDELPQLINVLLGNMSLVGPRPHALLHDDELKQQVTDYAHRRRIKPGITGWAQVNGFRGETVKLQQIEDRTRFDIEYIERWSIFLDIWILLLTVFSRKVHRNAF